MYTSRNFLRTVEYIEKKRARLSLGDAFEKLKTAFLAETTGVPKGLCRETFTYFLGPAGSEPEITDDLLSRAHRLGDVIDLFTGEYNEENENFSDEDWLFLKESVNGYAEEMDMDVLTSIMSRIMERGLL